MIPYNPGFQTVEVGPDWASFRWVCDQPSTYQVNYGLTSAKGTLYPPTRPSVYYTDHTVIVTGLLPNTTYHAGVWAQASDAVWNAYNPGATPKPKTHLMDNESMNDWVFVTTGGNGNGGNGNGDELEISQISTDDIGIDKATIKWTTNLPSTSLVEYGTTTGYESASGLDSFE